MSRRTRPFWTLDCETDPFEPGVFVQPFIWGLYGWENGIEQYHTFATPAEVAAFLEDKDYVVFAHNGGKFDYHFLRDFINTGENISIIGGRLAKFRIGVCEFRDSFNILPVALGTFKKDEIDYNLMRKENRDEPNNRATILRYLRSDCVNLYELVSTHRHENGVVLTQASASMRSWSKISGRAPPRQSAAEYNYFKPYYYGGRVQCFESGIKRTAFKVVDINSAYPFAMLSPHPFSNKPHLSKSLPSDDEWHKCLIQLECTADGCFPWRNEKDGSLYFPEDEGTRTRTYSISGYEFLKANELNAIRNIRILSVANYEHAIDFKEFILESWEKRAQAKKEGNTALDIIEKLRMNSLYGKFCSDYDKYHEYLLSWVDDLPTYKEALYQISTQWTAERFLLERKLNEDKHRYYNIATGASITGYVRAMIYEAIRKSSGVIYCDTDSIAAESVPDALLGDGLGKWKVEGAFDSYAVAGKKTYAFHKLGHETSDTKTEKGDFLHYKVASKGVRLLPSEIIRAASGEATVYSPMVPTYSVKRAQPIFTPRKVGITAKDIRKVN